MNDDADIKKSLESVVLYRLDCESEEGKVIAKEYGVRSYPTFVLLNNDVETADRWVGYSKNFFLETISGAVVDLSSIEAKAARFEKKQNLNDAVVLGRYNSALREFSKAVMYYTYANANYNGSDKDFTYAIFSNTFDGISDTGFSYDDVLVAIDVLIASENANFGQKTYAIQRTVSKAKSLDKPELVEKYINSGLKLVEGSDDDDSKMAYAELMVEHSLSITKDEAKAVEYKKITMADGWQDDAGGLNGFAWWCFENKINLVEAEKLARKGVELADPGNSKAQILDTVAEICNLLDNCHESVALIKLAMKENPDSKFYPEQLARFEKILASMDN